MEEESNRFMLKLRDGRGIESEWGSQHLEFLQSHLIDFTNLCPEIIIPIKTDKIKVRNLIEM